jgi:hypothetical protein
MKTQVLVLAAAGALCCAAADLRCLLPVTHLPSGAALARSMGLFGIYRVFSDGRRYGKGMWDWPSEAAPASGGAVAVRWRRPRTGLLRCGPCTAGPGRALWTSSTVPVKRGRFMAAERANGQWQMFPRSPAAAAWIGDGRWKIPPNPVDWVIQPEFEQPMAVRRDPASGFTAVVMAPARDCFAIATPDQADSHYSIYLSLFGRDVKKGKTARARARLVVLSSPDEKQVRELYRSYARGK